MKTKLIRLMVALSVLALPALVQAQFTFTTNNGAITITGYNPAAGLDVVIPDMTNGYPVTSIGDYAFEGSGITNVTIPSGLTSIGDGVFEYCTRLTSVTIPNSVTNIGDDAFASCRSLTSVTIPASVTRIGGGVFDNCISLTSVTIPGSVTSIGDDAFAGTSLTSVTIPASVTSIGDYAFGGASLTSVTIPGSVTNIADDAFGYCYSLTNIAVAAANPAYSSLGGVWFDKAQATLLQFPSGLGGSYTITNSVTSIGDSAFESSGITSVTIPNSVTSIGNQAFSYCTRLTSVTIPGSVTNMGKNAFEQCGLTNVTIPTSVTSIGIDAFDNCYHLTSVTIPSSVTSIGGAAFQNCFGLSSINVDAANPAYSSLGGVLFDKAQATLLQFPGGLGGSYTIPNSVTSIGAAAFYGCGLSSVVIPNSVTNIGYAAFEDSSFLTSVTIPNSVTSIGVEAFYSCISLTNVTIPNSVTSIGDDAFGFCGLSSVTIPTSVTSIGGFAFEDCISLTSVTIPNSVTSIGLAAFYNCNRMTSVTIPASVTSIGNYAFDSCTSLTSVYFQGNSPSPTNDSTVFSSDPATVYYLPGTTGWGAMFDGLPTAPWFLPNPLILNHGPGFGVQPGGFGFTISWATNVSVVVEAATNLANPVWIPVSTSPLTNGTNYFSDPQWTNYPERFYRAASAFTVSGTLTGLPAGDTVTLQDNGSDNLTLSNNGTFTFPTALPNGQSYSVTYIATTSRFGAYTFFTNGSGAISGANVTNVAVTFTPVYTGNPDVDMLNAAVADGTDHGGVAGVMYTENGGPFLVTAIGPCTHDVALVYAGWARFATIVEPGSCSSTTFPVGTHVIQFGTVVGCGAGYDHYYGY